MVEVLGTWAGLDRRVGALRRKLLDKPEMEREALVVHIKRLVPDRRCLKRAEAV